MVASGSIAERSPSNNIGPLSVPPSFYWDGNDGPWSTFGVQIGSPPQNVRVLPATGTSSLWVVLPEGCSIRRPVSCQEDRGRIFSPNISSTWENMGIYSLPLVEETALGYAANASVGHDNVTLGWQNDQQIPIGGNIVAALAAPDFFVGSLGLSPRPEYIASMNNPQASMLAILRDQSKIPSLSWSYTAGASFTTPKTAGSLILGGCDQSRFVSNHNISVPFEQDFTRDLSVGITSFMTDHGQGNSFAFKLDIYALVDSVVSHMWLPVDACEALAKAFDLVYDNASDLYVITESSYQQHSTTNANLTFTLTPSLQSRNTTIDISIPYAAMALNASYPFFQPGNSTRYFPIRRAPDSTHYTLGRAFLQAAYVITDYERSEFTISQSLYPDTLVRPNIVSISSPNDSNPGTTSVTGGSSHRHLKTLSTAAIAGIVIGIVFSLGAISVIAWITLRRRKLQTKKLSELDDTSIHNDSTKERAKTEILGEEKVELSAEYTARHEMQEEVISRELDSTNSPYILHELSAMTAVLAELDGNSKEGST